MLRCAFSLFQRHARCGLLAIAFTALLASSSGFSASLASPNGQMKLAFQNRLVPMPGSNNVIVWNNAALQAIRDTSPGPTIAARVLAITHTCIFDAWAAYDPIAVGTRLGGALRRPVAEDTLANRDEAISFGAYRALTDLFPTEGLMLQGVMTSLGYDPNDNSVDTTKPDGIGNVACGAVLQFRHHDESNQLGDLHPGAYSDYTGYVPTNTPNRIVDPNLWQPLSVSDGHGGFVTQRYYTPQWGLVTPFALSVGAQLRPAFGPERYHSGGYVQQAKQLLEYSADLSDTTKVIAEYWKDGPHSETPPGHWNLFAQFVSHRDSHTLDQDVKMFFALDNALLDASTAVWDCKRSFNSVRPITASLGRPVSGYESHRRRQLDAVSAGHSGHAAVSGIRFRPQRLQRRWSANFG
jgi:hypothetical protein